MSLISLVVVIDIANIIVVLKITYMAVVIYSNVYSCSSDLFSFDCFFVVCVEKKKELMMILIAMLHCSASRCSLLLLKLTKYLMVWQQGLIIIFMSLIVEGG